MRRSAALILGALMLTFVLLGPEKAHGYGSNLTAGQWLYANPSPGQNQSLTSQNGVFSFVMQSAGNLVLYSDPPGPMLRALWWTSTYPSVLGVTMQAEGNLVIYNTSLQPLWWTNTADYMGEYLTMKNDGNAVIYRANGTAPWSTETYYATNTESLGNGDCWRPTTPHTCRTNWSGSNPYVRFRAVNQFPNQPQWQAGAQAAVNAWNSAPGPQLYSFTPVSNDRLVYLADSYTGDPNLPWDVPLPPNAGGVTVNYRLDNTYSALLHVPINANASKIFLNRTLLNYCASGYVQHVIAHESGHAMMLAHNFVDSSAIMFPSVNCNGPFLGGPNGNDIGAYPDCRNGGFGVRCIYGLW